MKAVKRICAVLVGLVFFVAGMAKLMDPVGAGLVVGEYFNFLHLGFLAPLSRIFGVVMALVETLLGVALITGIAPKVTGIVSSLVMGIFTILTLVLWIVNPAMDCGCFGEAIHLTHFQSFIKNVVLCLLLVVALVPLGSVPQPRKVKRVSFSIAVISVIAFAVWSLFTIPPMDFTPFRPGVTLLQAQTTSSDDSPLLSICNAEGEYCDELLAEGPVLLLSAYDELSGREYASLRAAAEDAGQAVKVLVLDATGMLEGADYSADRRTLMTLNRSNGGATLLSGGMVISKWPRRSLPSAAKISELLELDPAEAMMKENTPKRLKLQGFLLYVSAVLLLL